MGGKAPSPSWLSPLISLAAINFFLGDVQGGLGPFLQTWLAGAGGWSPARIGTVVTLVGLASLALNGPAGLLVDRLARPRLLLCIGCAGLVGGSMLLLVVRSFIGVLAAEFLSAAGGTLVLPALTSLTLGIVGKDLFPQQQGRNQAFNHAGLVLSAVLVTWGAALLGGLAAFWVFGAMGAAAIAATVLMKGDVWNGRRAHGWNEAEEEDISHPTLRVIANRPLLLFAVALTGFNLANGCMLGLLGQKLTEEMHVDATFWVGLYVVTAQLMMIPVALGAGALADRRGRRHLLLVAFAAQIARGVLVALIDDPAWLITTELLDGIASGLLGVAIPVMVADLTWGTGRTQTAYGVVNTVQGVGTAVSTLFGALLVGYFGWSWVFAVLAAPPALALLLGVWLEETAGSSSEPRSKAASISARV
ncbi:MAG: MFS transporter [Acidisphaera sp.]|nr:MFS transporter [Acidisphaera sp.]